MHIEKIYSALKGLLASELKTREVEPLIDDSDIVNDFICGELVEVESEAFIYVLDHSDEYIAYPRFSIEPPEKCVIPDDMFEFYKELNNYIKTVKPYTVNKYNANFKFHEPHTYTDNFDSLNLTEGILEEEYQDFNEPHDRAIHLYDYFSFFHDPYSVDNGHGSFIINLNIKSVHYGNVYSYSSNDEGTIIKMVNSFSEFIDCIICNLDQLKEGERYPKESICDIFSFSDDAIYPGFKTKPAK